MYKVFIISWSISLIYHSDLIFAFVIMHYLGTLITLKYYQLLSISRTKIQPFLEPFWTRVWTQTRNVWTQKDSDLSPIYFQTRNVWTQKDSDLSLKIN